MGNKPYDDAFNKPSMYELIKEVPVYHYLINLIIDEELRRGQGEWLQKIGGRPPQTNPRRAAKHGSYG